MIAAVALVTLLMQAQIPPRDARSVTTGGTATVSGVVVSADAQPRPLRRARVTLNGAEFDVGRTAITADDGSFAFDGVPAGRFTLAATKDGYVAMSDGATRSSPPGTSVAVADGQAVHVSISLPRGAVITGTVIDADGLPSQGITVRALTHRYVGQQGERRFIGAGMPALAVSDDRGVYRIFGLPAGDYVVTAQPQQPHGGPQGLEVRTVSRGVASEKGQIMTQVFHPGATEVARATRVTLRAGEERSGIDIQIQYVPLANIGGLLTLPAGSRPPFIWLVPSNEMGAGMEMVRTTRADADGRFAFTGVAPGHYTISAQTNTPSGWFFGLADAVVDGEDLSEVGLSVAQALTMSGRIVFDSATGRVPFGGAEALAALSPKLMLPMFPPAARPGMPQPEIQIESGGRFTVSNLAPGTYRVFTPGGLQGVRTPVGGWWLKSIAAGGRDLLDRPFEFRQSLTEAVVTFADDASEIAGRVTGIDGAPAREASVVVFSADKTFWFPSSRRIAGVRTNAEGLYSVRNLPPGEYRIAVTAGIEQGEWFDPSFLQRLLPAAGAVTVTGVETQTRDLVIRQ